MYDFKQYFIHNKGETMSELDITTINVNELRGMTKGEFKSGDKIEKEYPFLEDYIVDQRTKLRETLEKCLNNFKNGVDWFEFVYTLPNIKGIRIKKKYYVVSVSKNLEDQFDCKYQFKNEDTGKNETTGIRTFIKEKITGIYVNRLITGKIIEDYYDTDDFQNMSEKLVEKYEKEIHKKLHDNANLLCKLTNLKEDSGRLIIPFNRFSN